MSSSTPTAFTIGHAGELTAAYHAELARLPLADNTRRAYRTRVANLLAWLVSADLDGGDPLADPHARDYAVRDYTRYLRVVGKKEPATINAVLAALDHFYRWRGLGPPNARRQDLPQLAPRALEPAEQRRFLRAVERSSSTRDRALALTLFYAGPWRRPPPPCGVPPSREPGTSAWRSSARSWPSPVGAAGPPETSRSGWTGAG